MKRLISLLFLLLISASLFAEEKSFDRVPYEIQGVLYVKSNSAPDEKGLYYYDKPLLRLDSTYLSSSAVTVRIVKTDRLVYKDMTIYYMYSDEPEYTYAIITAIKDKPSELGLMIFYRNKKEIESLEIRIAR